MLVSISAALSTQIQELVVLLNHLVVPQNVEVGDEDGSTSEPLSNTSECAI